MTAGDLRHLPRGYNISKARTKKRTEIKINLTRRVEFRYTTVLSKVLSFMYSTRENHDFRGIVMFDALELMKNNVLNINKEQRILNFLKSVCAQNINNDIVDSKLVLKLIAAVEKVLDDFSKSVISVHMVKWEQELLAELGDRISTELNLIIVGKQEKF